MFIRNDFEDYKAYKRYAPHWLDPVSPYFRAPKAEQDSVGFIPSPGGILNISRPVELWIAMERGEPWIDLWKLATDLGRDNVATHLKNTLYAHRMIKGLEDDGCFRLTPSLDICNVSPMVAWTYAIMQDRNFARGKNAHAAGNWLSRGIWQAYKAMGITLKPCNSHGHITQLQGYSNDPNFHNLRIRNALANLDLVPMIDESDYAYMPRLPDKRRCALLGNHLIRAYLPDARPRIISV